MKVFRSIGRRKTSVARVLLFQNNSNNVNIKVNNIDFVSYFPSKILRAIIERPFNKLSLFNYSIFVNIKGGGFKGQAEAIQLAISRVLCKINSDFRVIFKKEKLLTRDSRMVERKKPGRKKSRKKFQFSKR
jgi:small subunit ribosomal protein S9